MDCSIVKRALGTSESGGESWREENEKEKEGRQMRWKRRERWKRRGVK